MPHSFIAGTLHPAGLALLDGGDGFTYDYVEEVSQPSCAPLIGKTDALVIRTQPLSSTTIARADVFRPERTRLLRGVARLRSHRQQGLLT